MSEPMRPVIFKADRELIEKADRLAKEIPEYEKSRSRFIRTALRNQIDRDEATIEQKAKDKEAA